MDKYEYRVKTEQMQEYMISREPSRTTEFAAIQPARGVSDEATRQFRSIMDGKQEKEPAVSGGNSISKALRTVSVAALLLGVGFGLAAWYKYDGMRGIREVASIFTGKEQAETGEALAARVNVLQELSARMAGELGREATVEELAERMQTTSEEIKGMMKLAVDALRVVE